MASIEEIERELEFEISTGNRKLPLAQITVQVTAEEEDLLEIHEGDDLTVIVRNFCAKWNLNNSIREVLELQMMHELGESGLTSLLNPSSKNQTKYSEKGFKNTGKSWRTYKDTSKLEV